MKKLLFAATGALALLSVGLADAQVITYADSAPSGERITVPVTPSKPLPTTCVSGCSGGGGGSLSATASANPTPVTAGANKPLNIGLFSNLFTTPVTPGGTAIDLSAPSGIFGADGATIASNANPVPVSVQSSALPTGAATGAAQTTAQTSLSAIATSVAAATPAGENHLGEVGGNQVKVALTPTLTATTYTTGQSMGGLQTFTSFARVSQGTGLVQSFLAGLKVANTVQIDVMFFDANPSGTTCTNAAAFVLGTADIGKVIGTAHITDWTAGNPASSGQSQNLATPFALPSGTSLFACVIPRGSITTTGTADLVITINPVRN